MYLLLYILYIYLLLYIMYLCIYIYTYIYKDIHNEKKTIYLKIHFNLYLCQSILFLQ